MDNKKKSNQTADQDEALIVGLGASAGGLEALKVFFSSLPEQTGMAFIVIVHLSPDHKSSMAELLQLQTKMEVRQVNRKTRIETDHVYIIPPNKKLTLNDGHIELSKAKNLKQRSGVIDHFFRSVAVAKGKYAICISLSGTGSDGILGMKAVKEKGGLTIVQDPKEASYSGMPQSVIDAGLADKVLQVKEMPNELQYYRNNLFNINISDNIESFWEKEEELISKILTQIKSQTGHDFFQYKHSTLLRRIERRIHVTHCVSIPDYYSYLQEHPGEVRELFKDLLISVTSFFRNAEAYKSLEKNVIPKLFEGKHPDDQIRVWVPGCATGEEAYSLGILLLEHAKTLDYAPQIQIFATDIDEHALQIARKGRYPESISNDLTEKRLHQFFIKDGYEYHVSEALSKIILFAKHNLLGNPPFSSLDLISCRNLLIYLNSDLQAEVFNLFHYALRSGGWLFLGSANSKLESSELFTVSDSPNRILRSRSTSHSKLHLADLPLRFNKNQLSPSHSWKISTKTKKNFEDLHQSLMAEHYTYPSVIINEGQEVLYASGDIGKYLMYKGGEPSRNILEMVIPGLRQQLRSLLFQFEKKGIDFPISKKMQINFEDKTELLELNLHKIEEPNFPNDLLCIVFRDLLLTPNKSNMENKTGKRGDRDAESEIIDELQNELDFTKEQLQATVQDYETSHEELRAANEELQSMNEELQSTAEELETSQEELHSVNEELKAANRQLESKIENLHLANSDLKNLMESTEIGIIFVDTEYRVKRFTSSVTDIINLTSSDEGRPLDHFTHLLNYDSLTVDIKEVLETHKSIKKEVSGRNGFWYIMRLRPYVTTEGKVEGVVITFMDVTELKQAKAKLEEKINRIKDLQREILKNDLNERWKVGQYLHDELSQLLIAAQIMIKDLEGDLKKEDVDVVSKIENISEILKDASNETRDLSREIIPISIEAGGVTAAFKNLAARIEETYGITCSYHGIEEMESTNNIEMATNLYRISHEAVKNAAVHGEAENIAIEFQADEKYLYLNIKDDGKGFSGDPGDYEGIGLNIMRHRAELLGGTFKIVKLQKSDTFNSAISCSFPKNILHLEA